METLGIRDAVLALLRHGSLSSGRAEGQYQRAMVAFNSRKDAISNVDGVSTKKIKDQKMR